MYNGCVGLLLVIYKSFVVVIYLEYREHIKHYDTNFIALLSGYIECHAIPTYIG